MEDARQEWRPLVAANKAQELLFVDPGVDHPSILLDGLRPEVEVVRLPVDADPIATIALHMAGRRHVSALHILSHGTPGALALSGQRIDAAALAARPALTASIRGALSEDAEIVLYGCSVAQGPQGAAFVDLLSTLLDRPVAASDSLVGTADLGGDWRIPARGALAFGAEARAAYPATLAKATFGIVTTINTTTTLTANESGTTIDVVRSDGTAMAGVSSGFLDAGVIGNTVTYTLTFGSAVNITQFQIGEFANNTGSGNYVFTPNTGTAVVIADDSGSLAGSVATLTPTDWTGVTSFTVSYTGSVSYRIGLDNISFTSAGPATPGTPDLLAASDTGVSSTDNITSNSLPTIAGTADASTSVHILVGGVTVGTTTSDGGGNWTYAFTSTLAAGANSVTAIADNGTTESSASTALSITVDTTAPTTLGTPDLLAASDNGVSSTDNITNATTQQLSGSATTGDIVSILVGGVTVNNVTAAGGSWSYTHTLTAGTYSITSQATDTAGNAGPVSTALSITIDTTAPTTLGTPDLLAASDTGASSTDNITSSTTQQLSGSATTGDIVSILVGGVTVNNVTAAGGSWSYTHTLTAGTHSITTLATDTAGNSGPASTALSLTVDTTAPTTLGTPDLLAASDTGVSSTDNITSSTTQQLSGSATTGDIVSILVGGVTVNNVTAAGGSWSYTHTLTAGTHSITTLATDTAGNSGPASTALSLTVDTTAPTTLGTADLLAASDTGASSTDNITSSTTQQLSGSATTGDIVSILVGGVTVNNVTAAGGSWSYTHTLTAGTYSITTQATDTAGNAGPASTALSLTVDTTAPATAGTPDLLAASDTGVSSTDNITSNNLPTFTGTSEASASVHILLGGTTVGTTTADGGGNWTYTFTTTLAAGANSITSVATDAAGNAGPASTALSVTVGNAPVFSSLNGGATFTQNGTAATIDSDVTVSDTEFAALNGANGNFAGGSLVIVRNGGAVTSDTFAFNASGGVTQNGTNLLSGGNTIASFDTTTAGQLTVTFANNGTIPTTALVNTVLQNITFSNAATAQVGTATLNWTFSDGTLTSTGTNQSTVTIAAAPDNGGGGGGGGGSSGGDSTGTIVVTPTTPTVIATNTSQTITNNGSAAGSAAIVQNTGNNSNLVTATLPASVSITSEGPATAQSGTTASATLVTAIQARGSTGQTGLVNNAGTFLNRLSTTSTLDIRTIVPTQSSGATTSDPIIITGSTGTGQSEAFVIDMRSITGKTLQLDNIEFASIIGNATVSGGSGNNYATGDDASQFISLGVGDDTLFGGEGDDTVASGGGLDELYGEAGNDMVIGGAESDTVYGGADQDVVYGNQAADVVYGNQGVDTLYGGQDNDTLFGGQHQDLLYGNFGDDVLYGNLGGDTMYGGLGNDVLYGGDSEGSHLSTESIDYLFGGQGNDTLYGGKGADLMAGGDGNDVVVIQADGGADTVSDFAGASGDRIHITANVNGTSIDTFAELQAAAANNTDGNAVITLGTGNTLTLTGVNTSQLQSDWFLFI